MRQHLRHLSFALALAFCDGCGSGVSLKPLTTGKISFLNGATTTSRSVEAPGVHSSRGPSDGNWHLSPQKMQVTITSIDFLEPGSSPLSSGGVAVSGCTATYDQTQASLIKLSDCSFKVPAGTYGGVKLEFSSTYQVLISDSAGFYTDPSSPNGLSTSEPAGGAKFVSMTDPNGGGGTSIVTTYFASPVSIDGNSAPQAYVVFNPIHWVTTQVSGGKPGTIGTQGNPPLAFALSGFGKAAFYSNLPSIRAFNSTSCPAGGTACSSLLFLYADAQTPVSVEFVDFQNYFPCNGKADDPSVIFNQDGLSYGTYGRLGRDPSGKVTWALPGAFTGDGGITGYRGLMQMTEASTIGQSAGFTYHCTTSLPPLPAGASNYSTAPSFTPDASPLSLTLLAQ